MKPDSSRDSDRSDQSRPPSTPYGPHPDHVDEASGGADSSPFETLSSNEREQRRDAARRGENPTDGDGSRP